MSRSVVLLSAGIVSAHGSENAQSLQGIRTGISAIGELTSFEAHEDSPGLAAEIRDFEIGRWFPSIKSYVDRCTALALKAAKNALDSAPCQLHREEIGLVFGSEFGCMETMRLYTLAGIEKGWRFAPPFVFVHSYANTPAAMLHIELGLKGFGNVFSGSPDAGALALADAVEVISSRKADVVIVGASEALGPTRYEYIRQRDLLGSFDEPSEENTPGEGAAFIVLSASDSEAVSGFADLDRFPEIYIADYNAAEAEDPLPGFLKLFGNCSSANAPMRAALFALDDSLGRMTIEIPNSQGRTICLERKL
ncbi:MAG: hypothetical protein Kow00107_07290 [Planctomycetota bacterium]